MSGEHTPDTETVRDQYTREQPPHIGTVSEKSAEFDRWLAEVKAQTLEDESLHLREQISYAQDAQKSCDPSGQRYSEYSHAISHMTQEANRLMLRANALGGGDDEQ